MKHEIKIPKRLKVGGHDYKIRMGGRVDKELQANSYRGAHSDFLKEIDIANYLEPQGLSCTFIHEVAHAVDSTYCNGELSEWQIKGMANGIHQVLEQLGVRFIK